VRWEGYKRQFTSFCDFRDIHWQVVLHMQHAAFVPDGQKPDGTKKINATITLFLRV
jgi:hypothetical protein